MKVYSAAAVERRLPYPKLVEALRVAFRNDIQTAIRSFYAIDTPSGMRATYGLMSAWQAGEVIATKLVTVFPDNAARQLPTIHAQIVLFDGKSGVPAAIIDGTEITRRRTAAASALASTYLAREDARELLVLGTGPQAFHQALAHAAVRPISRIHVWGRSPARVAALVQSLRQYNRENESTRAPRVETAEDLESAARGVDIISCATSAAVPLIEGRWLKPGSFLDLVGSHSPERRESDDDAVRRSNIYVDTLEGALAEAGDLLIPMKSAVIGKSDIRGDLHSLCRNQVGGRTTGDEITLFKSVGTAVEDLAAAKLVYDSDSDDTPAA
jgi:alanine dehydrogenase